MRPTNPREDDGQTLTCARCEARFSEAFDGILARGIRERFDRHLATCPACRADYESFVTSIGALRSHVAPELPRSVYERILHLTAAEATRPWNRPGLAWSIAAAALLVAGLSFVIRLEAKPGDAPPVAEVVAPAPRPIVLTAGATLHVRRGSEVLRVEAGSTFVPRTGDALVTEVPEPAIREVVREVQVHPAFTFQVDTHPLAHALGNAIARVRDLRVPTPHPLWSPEHTERVHTFLQEGVALLSERLQELPPAVTRDESPATRRSSATAERPLLTVRDDGNTRLEENGSLDEIIPELLLWLDAGDTARSALARSRLEQIQRQLALRHGIPAPERSTVTATRRSNDLEHLVRSLDRTGSQPLLEPQRGTLDWSAWWNRHRERIRDLEHPRRERDRASI